jgi:hypothetical protein
MHQLLLLQQPLLLLSQKLPLQLLQLQLLLLQNPPQLNHQVVEFLLPLLLKILLIPKVLILQEFKEQDQTEESSKLTS